jgi:hypothetical protein
MRVHKRTFVRRSTEGNLRPKRAQSLKRADALAFNAVLAA